MPLLQQFLDSAASTTGALAVGVVGTWLAGRVRAHRRQCSVDLVATRGWLVRHGTGCPCRVTGETLQAAEASKQRPGAPAAP